MAVNARLSCSSDRSRRRARDLEQRDQDDIAADGDDQRDEADLGVNQWPTATEDVGRQDFVLRGNRAR